MRPGQMGLQRFRTKLLCIIAIVLHNIYLYIHIRYNIKKVQHKILNSSQTTTLLRDSFDA